MKIRVNPHNVEIVKEQTEPINEREIKVSKCEFEFDEAITSDFVKEAYFTLNGETYKQIIVNNECDYPNEVLTETGTLEIGVVAYKVENGEELIRYNPSPDYYDTWVGSLKDAENSEPITPTDKEQMQSQISQNTSDISDLQNNKVDKIEGKGLSTNDYTTEEKNKLASLENYDDTEIKQELTTQGTKIEQNKTDIATINTNLVNYSLVTETGSKITLTIDNTTYQMYATLKDKNNNTISTSDVIDLPIEQLVMSVDYDDTIKEIVIELQNGEITRVPVGALISGLVSETQLEETLEDYVKNTDYATSSKGGVIKVNDAMATQIGSTGNLIAQSKTYEQYLSLGGNMIIGKTTLENVITGKGLTTKAYVDDTIEANNIDVQVNNTSIVSNNVANILTEGVYGTRNKLLTKGYADTHYVLEERIDDNVGYMHISPSIIDDKDVDFSINAQSNLDSEAYADMNFGVEYDENEGKGNGYFRLRLYDAGSIEIDNTGTKITKVITPTNNTDAVNKLYVDSLVGDIGTILDSINGEVIGG